MKKKLRTKRPFIAALLVLIALTTTVYAVDVSCLPSMDDCPLRPDSCGCSSVTPQPLTLTSNNGIYTTSGGRAPYEVEITGGVTLGYGDDGVTVADNPECVEMATLKVNDVCGQTATKEVQFSSSPLVINGPTYLQSGNTYQFTATGSPGTYTWATTVGSISSTGLLTISSCTTETGAVTVSSCGDSASIDVQVAGTGGYQNVDTWSRPTCEQELIPTLSVILQDYYGFAPGWRVISTVTRVDKYQASGPECDCGTPPYPYAQYLADEDYVCYHADGHYGMPTWFLRSIGSQTLQKESCP